MSLQTDDYYLCHSCVDFELKVKGSRPGTTYTVRHGWMHHYRDQLLDFSCTCPSYHYNHHKGRRYCKNINEVIDSKQFCGWDQVQDGLEPVDGKCPKCGEEVITINTIMGA